MICGMCKMCESPERLQHRDVCLVRSLHHSNCRTGTCNRTALQSMATVCLEAEPSCKSLTRCALWWVSWLLMQLALAGADVLGLLQLGLNCTINSKDLGGAVSRAASATSEAVARLPARLEPAVARSLITTAALRRHPAVSALAGCAAVKEHVYGPTLAAVLTHMVGAFNSVARLFDTPGRLQLTSDDVAKLLLAAARYNDWGYLAEWLSELEAAQLLTKADVTSMLFAPEFAACRGGCGLLPERSRWRVLQLPAAQQLDAAEVQQLLESALRQSCKTCIDAGVGGLCVLPAALELSPDAVAALIRAAAERQQLGEVALLFQLPAAQQLSSICLQLLQAAVQAGYSNSEFCRIVSLPAAQFFDSSDVAGLLRACLAAGPAS